MPDSNQQYPKSARGDLIILTHAVPTPILGKLDRSVFEQCHLPCGIPDFSARPRFALQIQKRVFRGPGGGGRRLGRLTEYINDAFRPFMVRGAIISKRPTSAEVNYLSAKRRVNWLNFIVCRPRPGRTPCPLGHAAPSSHQPHRHSGPQVPCTGHVSECGASEGTCPLRRPITLSLRGHRRICGGAAASVF